jgi:putative hemolysin
MTILIILLLIALNGYFSLAEIALVTVKKSQLSEEANKGNKSAQRALELKKDPEEFLSAVQVGITLLGILEGIYGGNLVAQLIEPLIARHSKLSPQVIHVFSLIGGIGLITYLSIVFGELLPKSIALQVPLKASIAVASSLVIFSRIAFPFVKFLTISTRFLLKIFSIDKLENEKITESDLKRILSTAYQQGVLDKDEFLLHENIFTFNKLTAARIMKPAKVILTISYDFTRQEVEDKIKERPYSYFPVYKKELHHIVGAINTKEFFINAGKEWQTLMHRNCFLPPEMEAYDIFLQFKNQNHDFGIVINSNRVFVGIVAMQDIMEGIFGDIPEREDYASYFYKQSDKTWVAEGFIHLQRITRTFSLDWMQPYEEKYINITELLKGELHHLPAKGEKLSLHNLTFIVQESDAEEVGKVIIQLQ